MSTAVREISAAPDESSQSHGTLPRGCSVLFCWLGWLAGWLAAPNILNQSIDMSNDKTYFKHAQSFIDQIQFC
jgi:hypothetical protein